MARKTKQVDNNTLLPVQSCDFVIALYERQRSTWPVGWGRV